MESETIDSLRVHVRRGLDRFCLGQYFTEYGLQETVKLIPDDVDTDNFEASGLMEKKCPFQVFLKAVASEIVKEKGVTKGRKKRIKDYVEILQAFSSEWVDYIRKNMRKKKLGKPANNTTTVIDESFSQSPLKKKGGGKRGPRGPYKKRKQPPTAAASPALSTPSPKPLKKKPPVDMETARREFEQERDEVMKQVPQRNKRLFNQVGFAKWGKTNLPAMALDPYSVPPGDIRDQWRKMFDNVVQKDRISKMGHLVWWIGPQTDGQSSYSVVPQHGFMSYEEGSSKGMHELPSKIKKMLDRGSELGKGHMETVEALRILNELALQPKEEREHPRSDFTEEEYWGIDEEGEEENAQIQASAAGVKTSRAMEEELVEAKEEEEELEEEVDDEEDDDEEELLDDEEDLIDSSMEGSGGKKPKKKKGKKRKKDIIVEEEDQTEIVYDDIEETAMAVPKSEADDEPPKKKKKKDKDKGKKKKKKKSLEAEEGTQAENEYAKQSASIKAEEAQSAENPASAELAIPRKPKPVDQVPSRPLTPVMDEPSAESGDSVLVDSDYGGDEFGVDTDEQLDEDPTLSSSGKKKDKKVKKKGTKSKHDKPSVKEEKDEKKAKKKKNKEKKEKSTKEPKKRTKAAEQRDLDMCEDEFLPLIVRLQSAREEKDISAIETVLRELLPVAESFAASFFSEYEIPKIMKQTKVVLEEAGDADLMSIYRKLWNKMKTSYAEKFKELPEGFKARKRKILKTPAKELSERGSEDEPSEKAASTAKREDAKPQNSPVRPSAPASETTEPNDKAVPSSPILKVPVKEGKRRISTGSEQLKKSVEKTPAPKPPAPKPKQKFSILNLVSQKKDNNKRLSVGSVGGKSSSTPSSAPSKKTVPSWVTAALPTSYDSFVGCDRREDRAFALEFLLQAAAHFPPNKGVNEESVARSLETAIYEWSQSKGGTWSDTYWDKVHAIVAAITGKRDVGTLVDMIMEGSFSSPKSLLKLSVEDLESSFEGKHFVPPGE